MNRCVFAIKSKDFVGNGARCLLRALPEARLNRRRHIVVAKVTCLRSVEEEIMVPTEASVGFRVLLDIVLGYASYP